MDLIILSTLARTTRAIASAASLLVLTAPALAQATAGPVAADSKPAAAPTGADRGPAPALNTGKPAGPAFIMRLADGFQKDTQYLSDYIMEVAWNGAGFSPRNVRFGRSGLTLVIEKHRAKSLGYVGAEFQRKGWYGYGRYEAVVKAPKGSGLVSSFFTHTNQYFGDPHDEIDIEFLGRNTGQLHINYFTAGKPAGSFYAPVPFDTSAGFHLYAYEWAPASIKWYADGVLVHEVHGPAANVPRTTGRVIANLWAGGPAAVEWLGPNTFHTPSTATYRCISHVPLGGTGRQCSDDYKPNGR